jgi:hypothetical protein
MVHQDHDCGLLTSMKSTHVVRYAVWCIKVMTMLIFISMIFILVVRRHLYSSLKTLNNPHSVHDGSSSSRLTLPAIFFRSMRVLSPPLLAVNCLSCSPLGGSGPPSFPPPGLTPFPSGSRQHPIPLSDTISPLTRTYFCIRANLQYILKH